jgi:hypothetical protein
MKKKSLFFLIIVLVFSFHLSFGQTVPKGIGQMALLKQFRGTWRNDSNKDTIYTADFSLFGSGGLRLFLRGVTHGNAWLEIEQLWGYDKKSDKLATATLVKNTPNLIMQSMWFTSGTRCEQVPYEYVANPSKANFRVVFEFKTPDQLLREEFVNNKSLGVEVYNKVK